MKNFFKKRKNIEEEKEKKEEIKKEDTLVLSKRGDKTSVFFNGKEIIAHSEKNPFLEVDLGEIVYKKGGKETKIKKILPLTNVEEEKIEDRIILNFYNKGYRAKTEIIDNNGAVKIKVKKPDDKMLTMNFPRGTKEKVTHYIGRKEYKNGEKQYITTRISNFHSSEGGLYSLKTAKEWEIEIGEKTKKMKVKGEKAKIYIVYGQTKEETVKEHRRRDEIIEKEKPKKEVYISVKKEKYKDRLELFEKTNIPIDGIIIDVKQIEEIKEITEFLKSKKKKAVIKVMPYVPKKKNQVQEEYLVKNIRGELYEEEIRGEKCYAIDLSNNDARRYIKNRIRKILDAGARGLVAERGYINKKQASFPQEEKFSYSEIWYILWQKLVREVVDEYPNKLLLLRNCGAKSPHYGYVMTDESKWKDIEKNRMALRVEKMKDCGMGEIITEIGGIDNEKEKEYKNFDKWLNLAKEMPLIIFGSIPEKVIKKNRQKICEILPQKEENNRKN